MKIERMGNEFVLCSGDIPPNVSVAFIMKDYGPEFFEALEGHVRAGSWSPPTEQTNYKKAHKDTWWVITLVDYNRVTFSEKNEFGVVCP